jgi:seryl-tRNA synthetase
MLDLKYLRENLTEAEGRLRTRGASIDLSGLISLDEGRRRILIEAEGFKAKRNTISEEIGKLKRLKKDAEARMAEMQEVSSRIKSLDARIAQYEKDLIDLLLLFPNLPHSTVPLGKDSTENQVVRSWGAPPKFDFTPLEHVEVGTNLGILDMEAAGKLSGARFSLMKGAGALLDRALINFMLDLHTRERGYREVLPPFMVKASSMLGTGQLPKFKDDLFKIEGWDHYLVPTAEVPLTNIHREEVIEEARLPIAYTAYTPCFRKEAGSYGKDVKGLIRLHQFNKVELVRFVAPETSYDALERLTDDAEEVLRRLKLHFRVVTLCTGDLGFSSAKTYDIEVWLPSQGKFREISSCSNFEEFQARRANIRYRPKEGRPRYLHTLNGSGLAVGRTVVAILENYQQKDGTVVVPEALRPYMRGLDRIVKKE